MIHRWRCVLAVKLIRLGFRVAGMYRQHDTGPNELLDHLLSGSKDITIVTTDREMPADHAAPVALSDSR